MGMELVINHKKKSFEQPLSSLEALMHLEAPGKSKGIAVAVNNLVIPIANWQSTPIKENDFILIITATQGG